MLMIMVDVVALGEAEDRAHFTAQLTAAGVGPREELLGALRGLGHQRGHLGGMASPTDGAGALVADLFAVELLEVLDLLGVAAPVPTRVGVGGGVRCDGGVLVVVAHRGPGASLNWTGTRPTP
jgi:hypothetical protein